MVREADETDLTGCTLLQELVAEMRDAENPSLYWTWHLQLREGTDPRSGATIISARARKLATRHDLAGGPLHFLETRDDRFYIDLNQVELATGQERAKLAPRHDIIMSQRGTGLGRVLMSLVIRRAKERFAHLPVAPAYLGFPDASTDEDRDRRNGFYVGHGFQLDFSDDPERRVGHVYARRIGDLTEAINPNKVSIVPVDDLVRRWALEMDSRATAERRVKNLEGAMTWLGERASRLKRTCIALGLIALVAVLTHLVR